MKPTFIRTISDRNDDGIRYIKIVCEDIPDTWIEGYLGPASSVAACAKEEDQIEVPANRTEGVIAVLDWVYVQTEHRRQGLGQRLMADFLAVAYSAGAEIVYLHCKDENDWNLEDLYCAGSAPGAVPAPADENEANLEAWYRRLGFARLDPDGTEPNPVMCIVLPPRPAT